MASNGSDWPAGFSGRYWKRDILCDVKVYPGMVGKARQRHLDCPTEKV